MPKGLWVLSVLFRFFFVSRRNVRQPNYQACEQFIWQDEFEIHHVVFGVRYAGRRGVAVPGCNTIS